MSRSHVLVVAVDGLRASSLGSYGNTTYPTRALDQFASESMLLDACYAPSAELGAIYRALWHSSRPRGELSSESTSVSLPRMFSEHGYRTTLVTDEKSLLDVAGGQEFQEAIETPSSLTDVFAAGSDVVSRVRDAGTDQRQLVWLHTRGMYGPWLAPLELQQALLDEGDPPPVESAEPPEFVIDAGGDPDTAFRYGCAYAAQVMLFDECWKALLETIDAAGARDEWLISLVGVRGFPLGEHGHIGGVDNRLHVEQLHVPWLLRFPDGRGRLSRHCQLATHVDLLPTLYSRGLGVEGRGPEEQFSSAEAGRPSFADGTNLLRLLEHRGPDWREALISLGEGARAIRTANWTLRQGANSELYVRPDDRWEANDVAARCPDVVADLERALSEAIGPG